MLSGVLARQAFRTGLAQRSAALKACKASGSPVTSSSAGAAALSKTWQPSKTEFSTSAVQRSGDHVKLWSAERVVSAVMIPGFVGPFLLTTPATDALLCTLCVLHSHWGVEAIVVDYIRPSLFGGSTVIPNLAQALVWALSAFTLGALYYFNYTDIGMVNAIKMLWKL